MEVREVSLEPAQTKNAAEERSCRPSGRPSPAIGLFHAGGREAEVEEVFRRILALGVPLDIVEIACASDTHLALGHLEKEYAATAVIRTNLTRIGGWILSVQWIPEETHGKRLPG